MRKQKVTKLGLRKLHFSKSDEDAWVYIWTQNRL